MLTVKSDSRPAGETVTEETRPRSLTWGWTRRLLWSRRTRWTVASVVLLLVLFRISLPFGIKAYVNRQFDNMPDYDGQVGDIDVHLWRGAYQIRDLQIVKTTSHVPVPLFAAKQVDLSMEWKELFHGALVGEMVLVKPEIHLVAGPTPEQSQTGKDRPWGDTLASLFPFKLNRVEIEDGDIHFENFHSTPPVNIYINHVTATATNLTNSRDLAQPLPAGLRARGTTLGEGGLALELKMNPLAKLPTFEISGQLTNVDLVSLNDFLKAYGKFDVARGEFALFASFAAADGKYEGYAKVFFEDLDVFAWEKERKKNALEIFWHAIVGTAAVVLKNQPRDQLATKIPIAGEFQKTEVGIWSAAGTLLRHAFVRALVPRLDGPVPVEKIKAERIREEKKP